MSDQKDFALITDIIMKYLDEEEDTQDATVASLIGTNVSKNIIVSVFWTITNIYKSGDFDNYMTRIRLLGSAMAEEDQEFSRLFFAFMEKADWQEMALKGIKDIARQIQVTILQSQFIQYQLFRDCPEGFARLILAIFNGEVGDIVAICGQHKLDPTAILELAFDVYCLMPCSNIFEIIKIFSTDKVLQLLLYRMKTKFYPGLINILDHFIETGEIAEKFILSLYKDNPESFDGFYEYYRNAASKYAAELSKPLVLLPGDTKESAYSKSFFEARNQFQYAHKIFYSSSLFKQLMKLDDLEFMIGLQALAKYDPCQNEEICNRVQSLVVKSLESNSVNFDLIQILNSHCDDPRIINAVATNPDTPPILFATFVLPNIAASEVGWQLASIVFPTFSERFSLRQRFEIYKQFTAYQKVSIPQRIVVAKCLRKLKRIMRRLSKETGQNYALDFAQLMVRCPRASGEALVDFICGGNADPTTLELIIQDLGQMQLDALLWISIDAVSADRLMIGPLDVHDWPDPFAQFISHMFYEFYREMDLRAFLRIILEGIVESKTAFVCIFSRLIEHMCCIEYRGNLTSVQYQERCCDYYLPAKRRAIDEKQQFAPRSKLLKECLHEDDLGIKIIMALDHLKTTLPSREDVAMLPERLDQIQFAIIMCTEPLDLESIAMPPAELINVHGLSLPCAFHLTRGRSCTEDIASSLSRGGIHPVLFGLFWSLTPGDFHVPEKLIEQKRREWTEAANNETDESLKFSLELLTSKLEIQMKNQQKRVKEVAARIKEIGKSWFNSDEDYWNFVQQCIIPRSLFSELDARYSALFINAIFHYLRHIDVDKMVSAILCRIQYLIFSGTSEEASSFSFFIKKLMKILFYRAEKITLHKMFLEKMLMLLERRELNVLLNTIGALSKVMKYFPEIEEHFVAITGALDRIKAEGDLPDNLRTKMTSFNSNMEQMRRKRRVRFEAERQDELESAAREELESTKAPPQQIDDRRTKAPQPRSVKRASEDEKGPHIEDRRLKRSRDTTPRREDSRGDLRREDDRPRGRDEDRPRVRDDDRPRGRDDDRPRGRDDDRPRSRDEDRPRGRDDDRPRGRDDDRPRGRDDDRPRGRDDDRPRGRDDDRPRGRDDDRPRGRDDDRPRGRDDDRPRGRDDGRIGRRDDDYGRDRGRDSRSDDDRPSRREEKYDSKRDKHRR